VKVVSVVLFENLVPIFQTPRPLTLNASDAGKSQNFVFQTIGLIGAVEIAFQNHDPLFLSTVAGATPQRFCSAVAAGIVRVGGFACFAS
jgi:hypothetical protein